MSMTKEIPAVNIRRFAGVPDMRKIIIALAKALQEGSTNPQHLAFESVTTENQAKIDSSRSSLVRHAKISFNADFDLLIVKVMASGAHEMAYGLLSEDFRRGESSSLLDQHDIRAANPLEILMQDISPYLQGV